MGRALRIQPIEGSVHVSARGIRRDRIFADDDDRRMFMALLAQSVYRCRWKCLAYCLMTKHFHLVLSLSEPNLATGMHRLNGVYARRFNERHGYVGHLFEARYASNVIKTEAHFLDAVRYVVLNPVTAGLCDDPADWEWSSFRATAGLERCPRFLAAARVRAHFGRGATGAARYSSFVRDRAAFLLGA
jgi:REP element-mobilizing transposase RayT